MKPPRTPEGILDAVVKLSHRLTGQEPTDADIAEARARIMKHFAERERKLSEASADGNVDTAGPLKIKSDSERDLGALPSED
jgi:hypothetical protein